MQIQGMRDIKSSNVEELDRKIKLNIAKLVQCCHSDDLLSLQVCCGYGYEAGPCTSLAYQFHCEAANRTWIQALSKGSSPTLFLVTKLIDNE